MMGPVSAPPSGKWISTRNRSLALHCLIRCVAGIFRFPADSRNIRQANFLMRGSPSVAKSRSSSTRRAKSVAPKVTRQSGKKLKVALVGFGTVGRSVAKILCKDKNSPLLLTHIFNRNIERKKTAGLPAHIRWTANIEDIFSSDADVVVELIGGLEPAGDWVRRALRSGKSVATANKLLISESGSELLDLARKMGKRLEFGASVAGGIPAIVGIQEGLAGDRLHKIAGILNGTCNFILTKMESTGATFVAALKEAQSLGYAEADSSADIDGSDGGYLCRGAERGAVARIRRGRFQRGYRWKRRSCQARDSHPGWPAPACSQRADTVPLNCLHRSCRLHVRQRTQKRNPPN